MPGIRLGYQPKDCTLISGSRASRGIQRQRSVGRLRRFDNGCPVFHFSRRCVTPRGARAVGDATARFGLANFTHAVTAPALDTGVDAKGRRIADPHPTLALGGLRVEDLSQALAARAVAALLAGFVPSGTTTVVRRISGESPRLIRNASLGVRNLLAAAASEQDPARQNGSTLRTWPHYGLAHRRATFITVPVETVPC